MDYIYLILFPTLLDTILATIKCYQSCPDTTLCRLAEINTTCIMADVPCIRDYYSRDINQANKPIKLITSTENIWYIISWEPTNNNHVVNYSGFEVTIVTEDGKRQIYYMRILRSVVEEIVNDARLLLAYQNNVL
ncbi:uncharacterized protein [Mytilus edulis]|uniref:uncharacterized protein n=1 Tax=Mytilus edulis TaxID=6550 RepID=UPI0039F0FFE8